MISAPCRPLARFKGPTYKGRKDGKERRGKGRVGEGRGGKGAEGRDGRGGKERGRGKGCVMAVRGWTPLILLLR